MRPLIATSLLLAICCLQIATTQQDCTDSCEQKWDPVCGSDGKTHANKCIAKCAKADVRHDGRCKAFDRVHAVSREALEDAFACSSKCEQKWDPVCGSDRKTHANKCIAKCAGASVKHTGRCKTFNAFACTDNCEQKWDPVCGSDGKTYANKCIAKCAGASVKHTGRCKTFNTFACTDNCEQLWDPVCGEDGKTHANKCIAKCAGAGFKHAGRCTESLSAAFRYPTCSGAAYDPVCGTDDRTYDNACRAQRANIEIKHSGPCMRWGGSL